jgi:hypothetical protein
MLVAHEQLQFVRDLVARFERPSSAMVPVSAVQSQYIAIVVMLRAIGHTFQSVDCDTPEKVRWGKDAWKTWQNEPVFADFIKPTRDTLLKEFRGGLELRNDAFGAFAIYAEPGMPGNTTTVSDFHAERLTNLDGEQVLPKIYEALAFWDRHLSETEAAFRKLGA